MSNVASDSPRPSRLICCFLFLLQNIREVCGRERRKLALIHQMLRRQALVEEPRNAVKSDIPTTSGTSG